MTDENLNQDHKIKNDQTGVEYTVGELQHSSRIVKSATPKGDLSWYIKWASSLLVLIAITIRASNSPDAMLFGHPFHIWDILFSWLGALGWWFVGFIWKDRALILLNGVIAIMLFSGLLRYIAQ